MAYAGFQPLCGGGANPPARSAPSRAPPAPITSSVPRRTDLRAEGAVVVAAEESRSAAAELRRTYVDAEEVAMMRAMARLEGNDTARRVGNQYSQSNRARVQAQLDAKAAEGLVPQDPHAQHLARKAKAAQYTTISERGINVPRVGVRSHGPPPPPVAYIPHRPTRDEIAAAHGGFKRPVAPRGMPTRSNEERKDELALRNQFYGKTPEQVLAEGGAPRAGRRLGGRVGGKPSAAAQSDEDELRKQIGDEILERQAWLDDMQAMGKADPYEAQIKAQIAERLHDLKRLDRLQAP